MAESRTKTQKWCKTPKDTELFNFISEESAGTFAVFVGGHWRKTLGNWRD